MQIALAYYCKIESGALNKDSITEKNSLLPDAKPLEYGVQNFLRADFAGY